jgi:TonB family protein
MQRLTIRRTLIYRITLSVVCIFLPAALCHGQSSQGWRTYTSEEGKFSVLLPGRPETGTRPVGVDWSTAAARVVNLQTPPVAYIIAYFDIRSAPSAPEEVRQVLDQTRDRPVKMYGLRLERESDKTEWGFPGRELRMSDRQGKPFLSRIVLVRERVYHVSAALLTDDPRSEDVDRFFNSFRPVPLTDEEIARLPSQEEERRQTKLGVAPVSEGVLLSRVTSRVEPKAPAGSRESGTVEVRVRVSGEGNVVSAEAVEGPDELRPAAVEAVRQWTFKPVSIGGTPVEMEGVLKVRVGG